MYFFYSSSNNFQTESLSDLTIGVFPEYNGDSEPTISAAVEQTIQQLTANTGAKIKTISLPHLGTIQHAHSMTILTEMATVLDAYWKEHGSDLSPDSRIKLLIGRAVSGREYVASQQVRAYAMEVMSRVFENVDVIITPATAITAPEVLADTASCGETNIVNTLRLARYVFLGNFCGVPASTQPIGYDEQGRPIAVQIIAKWWDESVLLRVARAVEKLTAQTRRAPNHFFDVLGKSK